MPSLGPTTRRTFRFSDEFLRQLDELVAELTASTLRQQTRTSALQHLLAENREQAAKKKAKGK